MLFTIYSICKKYEDASIPLIASCSHTKEPMLVQAKILKGNLRLLDSVLEKASKQEEDPDKQTNGCGQVISANEELIRYLLDDPLRPVVRQNIERYFYLRNVGIFIFRPASTTMSCSPRKHL